MALHTIGRTARGILPFSAATQHRDLRSHFRGDSRRAIRRHPTDPRYGKNPPYNGMPEGHLPVRSYLALPVILRSGEVIGGLFFGHSQVAMFRERHERLLVGIASQAAMAMDNARLYEESQRELTARREAEQQLQSLNETLNSGLTSVPTRSGRFSISSMRANNTSAIWSRASSITRSFCSIRTGLCRVGTPALDASRVTRRRRSSVSTSRGFTLGADLGRAGLPELALCYGPTHRTIWDAEGWRVRKGDDRFWASVIINAVHDEGGS